MRFNQGLAWFLHPACCWDQGTTALPKALASMYHKGGMKVLKLCRMPGEPSA